MNFQFAIFNLQSMIIETICQLASKTEGVMNFQFSICNFQASSNELMIQTGRRLYGCQI